MTIKFDSNEKNKLPKSYNRYELNQREISSFLLVCGGLLMLVAFIFYHSILFSLVFSFLAIPGLKPYRNYLADKRKKDLKEQFRDALYSISSSIIAGRHMAEALYEAEENLKLIYSESSILVQELSYMVKRIFESRESEEELLKSFAQRSCNEDIVSFVDIYFTCKTTGGDLIRVTSKASEILMDKMTIEKEINTITSQKRFEAKVLTATPIIVIQFLQIASPDYLSVMYESLFGRFLMTLALIGIGISYYLSLRLTNIEV